jgi:hypothetical protein
MFMCAVFYYLLTVTCTVFIMTVLRIVMNREVIGTGVSFIRVFWKKDWLVARDQALKFLEGRNQKLSNFLETHSVILF